METRVYIIRDRKGRIIANSGKIVITDDIGDLDIEGLEIWTVSDDAIPPEYNSGRGYYCPYCESWEYWMEHKEYGVKVCPICGISASEYDVKRYNGLWNTQMKSKTSKRKSDRVIRRARK
jgi:hypothetical protein